MMAERMLQDIAAACGLRYVILRYFNVAGADPQARIGQATPAAWQLIKVACETALGQRPGMRISAPTTRRRRHMRARLHPCR